MPRNRSTTPLAAGAIRAVLIDLDGTVVDSAPDIVEAANRMLLELNAPPMSAAQVTSFIGNGVPTLVRRLRAAAPPLIDVAPDNAQSVFYRHYHATNGRFSRLFPGVLDGLIALKAAGYRLACVTNKPMDYTESLLQAFGLNAYLQAVVAGDSVAQMKPHPAPLLHACRLLGVPPQDAVMVGETVACLAQGFSGPGCEELCLQSAPHLKRAKGLPVSRAAARALCPGTVFCKEAAWAIGL